MIERVHRREVDTDTLRRTGALAQTANVAATTSVVDATTGDLLVVVGRYPADQLGAYRRAAMAYPPDTTIRSGGIRNKSRTFGFTSRHPMFQRNMCRSCTGAFDAPDDHAVLAGAAGALIDLLAELAPAEAERARAAVLPNVLPEWRMGESPWTSGVLNFDSPLPYHFDGNNFDAWSAMVVLRRNVDGGHLSIPEYGLALECRDGDVVFFNGSRLLHGVTPMQRTKAGGYRLTAVYYPVRSMGRCLPAAEEMAHGRTSRTAAEVDMVARQRRTGWVS